MMKSPAFRFTGAQTANRLVAGIPAAARLAQAFAQARPGEGLVLAIGGLDGSKAGLTALTRAEIARLAPGLVVTLVDSAPAGAIPGESLPDLATLAAFPTGDASSQPALADPDAALSQAAKRIVRATAKPSDGMVARWINRPLSQAVSAQLLRLGWVRPGHATVLTALAAAAMLACLIAFPSPEGLMLGAVLFQIASVIDGVDGEIARAAQRSSKAGASLDSLVDAVTNCAFLAGAGASFGAQGDNAAAIICAAALAVQIVGLTILGRSAWRREGVVHFDSAKAAIASAPRGAGRVIKDLTSRDFYCFAFMLASLAGVLAEAVTVFAAGSAVWLAFVIRTALRG